jgi:hypothetical protein
MGDEIKERVTKTLFIDSNDPARQRLSISVTGTILPGDLPHMTTVPNPLPVFGSQSGERVANLTITNRGRQDLLISEIRCFGCLSEWTEMELSAGEDTSLQIELLSDWFDKRWIEIESNDPVSPVRKVTIVELE